jgi:hypothetical protein
MADVTIISKGMRRRKLTINPIESVSELEYCQFCKDEVSVEVDQGKWQVIWVYRKRCLRCGKVIQWGAAKEAFTKTDKATVDAIASWVQATGRDRR